MISAKQHEARLNEAFKLAADATAASLTAMNGAWLPCGFSSVLVRPARGALITAMKRMGVGTTGCSGGYLVYNPSRNPTQSMHAKAAGAQAFRDHLAPLYPELTFDVNTRID